MQKSSTLYLSFALLGVGTALLMVLIFNYISPETPTESLVPEPQTPADLEDLLHEASDRNGWIYRMRLHREQNIFSYPRTVYHINLN